MITKRNAQNAERILLNLKQIAYENMVMGATAGVVLRNHALQEAYEIAIKLINGDEI